MNGAVYLIPFGLVFAMFAGMTYVVVKLNRWKALPTLEQYGELKNTKQDDHLVCLHCQSGSIQERGEWGKQSVERTFFCGNCQQKLYRSA